MTINERIQKAVESGGMEADTLDKLIALAYYKGREEAAKDICDTARGIFDEQHKRAAESRYYIMAQKVVGDINYIYHPDYAGDMMGTFGADETAL